MAAPRASHQRRGLSNPVAYEILLDREPVISKLPSLLNGVVMNRLAYNRFATPILVLMILVPAVGADLFHHHHFDLPNSTAEFSGHADECPVGWYVKGVPGAWITAVHMPEPNGITALVEVEPIAADGYSSVSLPAPRAPPA